jgi:hypothetical protein
LKQAEANIEIVNFGSNSLITKQYLDMQKLVAEKQFGIELDKNLKLNQNSLEQ